MWNSIRFRWANIVFMQLATIAISCFTFWSRRDDANSFFFIQIKRFSFEFLGIHSLKLILGQSSLSSSPSNCGCCPSEDCGAALPCSQNIDCICLRMTINGGGLCADIVLSCKHLTPCGPDNKTCPLPNTVCVDNTRCGFPVCYPVDFASSERCPPISSYNTSTVSTKSTESIETTGSTESIGNTESTESTHTGNFPVLNIHYHH